MATVFDLGYRVKPTIPVINWNNPITRGLVFDAPLFERGGTVANDIAGKVKGSITASGATWEVSPFGAGLAFSAAASNVVFSVPANSKMESMTKFTYETLFDYTGLGGGSLGRLFVKGSTNTYFMVFGDSTTLLQITAGFATTSATWTIPAFENDWLHMVISMDMGSASNTPTVYLDGAPVTVTTVTPGLGSAVADDVSFNIGNRVDGLRNWTGKIAYTRAWNRILAPSEARQQAINPWSIYREAGLLA